jgi:hypothetical protein
VSAWRRSFGTDFVETLLWIGGGFLTTIMAAEFFHDKLMVLATAVSLIVAFGIRRNATLKAISPDGEASGAWRAADLEARVGELEQATTRIAELEERLDFAERLLAKQDEPVKLEGPR